MIRDSGGQASLLRLVKQVRPQLLVTSSGYGDGAIGPEVATVCDFLTIGMAQRSIKYQLVWRL